MFSVLNLFLYCTCSFFFSSRRRHTRSYGDWSSDVCSSDLKYSNGFFKGLLYLWAGWFDGCSPVGDRSEERREGKSVDLGGRRIIKKKKRNTILVCVLVAGTSSLLVSYMSFSAAC